MSSDPRIEPATEQDVSTILRLIKELAAYERMSDAVVASEDDIRRALFAEPPAAGALIARVGEKAVGFALFFFSFSTFVGRRSLYLEDLYVEPASRGRGIGRRLLVDLARIAVERHCGRMEWSVLDWNELAMSSYRRVGAVPMSDWTVWRLSGKALDALARQRTGGC